MTEAVALTGVNKSYGSHRAVADFDVTIPEGSIFGFIGPNGSGKTTTLRMILRIIEPDSGRIRVFGRDHSPAAVDGIGYLPEERGLYRKMTVLRQLIYFGKLKGMKGGEAKRAGLEWLERFGLLEWKDQKMEALSKGMSQKIQFISTVVARPRLLILDEPFSGLDPVNREVIRDSLLEMKRAGTTLLFSTHDMPTAEGLCDTLCMIYRGRKVLDGTLRDIQRRYGQDTVRFRFADGGSWGDREIAGVEEVRERGNLLEARLREEASTVLRRLAGEGPLEHFEVVHPSLQDIFIRMAQPEPDEMKEEEGGAGDA